MLHDVRRLDVDFVQPGNDILGDLGPLLRRPEPRLKHDRAETYALRQ